MRGLIAGVLALILSASAWVSASAHAAGGCLPRPVAPATFPDPPSGPGAVGVVAPGFIDLKDEKGVYRVAHGVDLSDHNRPDYDKLKACGTDFVIIKLYPTKPKYNAAQIKALDERQIAIIPYYYLEMPGKYKYFPENFSTDDLLDAQVADAQAIGQADAISFLQTYGELFGDGRGFNLAGLSGPVIALDVEEAIETTTPAAKKARKGYPPLKQRDVSKDVYDRYGETYSAMVASWVKTVQRAQPGATILFYTYPDMYINYLIAARTPDFNVMRGLPVWLAEYTKHAGDLADTNDLNKKGAERLCLSSSAGNKCVVHQYTGRGVFGSTGGGAAYTDLNRFFTVTKVVDGVNVQFVRKIEYVPPAQP